MCMCSLLMLERWQGSSLVQSSNKAMLQDPPHITCPFVSDILSISFRCVFICLFANSNESCLCCSLSLSVSESVTQSWMTFFWNNVRPYLFAATLVKPRRYKTIFTKRFTLGMLTFHPRDPSRNKGRDVQNSIRNILSMAFFPGDLNMTNWFLGEKK